MGVCSAGEPRCGSLSSSPLLVTSWAYLYLFEVQNVDQWLGHLNKHQNINIYTKNEDQRTSNKPPRRRRASGTSERFSETIGCENVRGCRPRNRVSKDKNETEERSRLKSTGDEAHERGHTRSMSVADVAFFFFWIFSSKYQVQSILFRVYSI